MSTNRIKTLDLTKLIKELKKQEDEDNAEALIQDFVANNINVDIDDLKEYLATDMNCCECSRCGRYFGEDEFSDNDEDCIYCS